MAEELLTINNMGNNNKLEICERISVLETKIDSILNNHLKDLKETCDSLSNRFWAIVVLLIVNLVGLVFNLAQNYLK